MLGGNLLSTGEDLTGVLLHLLIVLLADDALCDDLLLRDVHVMTLISLGCRGDDRLWEPLVLAHAVGQLHAAQLTASLLVFSPGAASEDRTDDHLYAESFTFQSYGHHGVWGSQFPVRTDICRGIQELGCYLVQHLSFIGDTLG